MPCTYCGDYIPWTDGATLHYELTDHTEADVWEGFFGTYWVRFANGDKQRVYWYCLQNETGLLRFLQCEACKAARDAGDHRREYGASDHRRDYGAFVPYERYETDIIETR